MPFSLFLCVCEFILVLCVHCFRNSKGFRSDFFNAIILSHPYVKLLYRLFSALLWLLLQRNVGETQTFPLREVKIGT